MPPLPRDGAPNSTLALLSEGYAFIPNRCRRLGTDIFATRLMLRRAICMQGEEAARVFYEPDRFTRRSALPASTLRLLQDRGSVATLDGEAHRQRKRLFMALMTPDGIRRLSDPMAERWLDHLRRWEGMDRLVLHDAAQDILCRAVCRWAGIPLAEEEAGRRAREIAAMIDAAGAIGPRNWHATRSARGRNAGCDGSWTGSAAARWTPPRAAPSGCSLRIGSRMAGRSTGRRRRWNC